MDFLRYNSVYLTGDKEFISVNNPIFDTRLDCNSYFFFVKICICTVNMTITSFNCCMYSITSRIFIRLYIYKLCNVRIHKNMLVLKEILVIFSL